jgi:hypothetical protein
VSPSSFILTLLLALVTGTLGYFAGHLRGEAEGFAKALSYNDGDTPSGAEVRR